jgi:hypothetical protein
MKKPPGDDVSATITALRAQIAALQDEIATLDSAPVPLAEAEMALIAGIDRLAARYDPDLVLVSFTHGGADLGTVELLVPPAGDYETQRAAAFLCFLHRDALVAVLSARLRALYDRDPALARTAVPLAERPARVRHLRDRMRTLEVEEERLILAAERQGVRLDRRADVDVAVLFLPELLEDSPASPAA